MELGLQGDGGGQVGAEAFTNLTREPHDLDEARAALSQLPPPVVIFNKSHSGSRLLASLVEASGCFMGNDRNESQDGLHVFELVQYVVEKYYPDFSRLWHGEGREDTALARLAVSVFRDHLAGFHGRSWGWKLCETTYILPLVDRLFPQARYLHLVRDGRDVAFSNHRPPDSPFWQKIYADAVRLRRWRGLWYGRMARLGYALDPVLYNAQHWVNSVSVGRHFGAMLGHRCLEVRYEDLCLDFEPQARRILDFIEAPAAQAAIDAVSPTVRRDAVGKYRNRSRLQVWRVQRYAKPLLIALGYLDRRRR